MLFRKNITRSLVTALFITILMSSQPAAASDGWTPTTDILSNAYTGKVYSPYARRGIPEKPLWGDSHLHTALSMDAGLFGNRAQRQPVKWYHVSP